MSEKAVLNVGGGSKVYGLPQYYSNWRHDLLDVDPRGNPDIVADARELGSFPAATYDAVYCSHNLEHYHRHDGIKVLRGFHHVLKPDGFADIRVPEMTSVFRAIVSRGLDIDDVLHQSMRGPILVRDVIYGYHVEIEQTGNDYYSHKTGFTAPSLARMAKECGIGHFAAGVREFELLGFLFKQQPGEQLMQMLGLKR